MILRLILVFIWAAMASCSSATPELVMTGSTMGTAYTVRVVAPAHHLGRDRLQATIDSVLDRVDRSMSGYRRDSELAKFNAGAAHEWIAVSAGVARVVECALQISKASGGAFDITVAPLVQAWGFGVSGEPVALPDAPLLEELRALVGHRKLQVRMDPPALRKDVAGMRIDLNAIAPGFAVAEIAREFAALGLHDFLIDIGGEVLARGRNAHGAVWRVAVERPIDTEQAPYAIVQLKDASVTTSGEYRRYYVRDGKRYSHTIDPRTGQPIDHALASVVVVGEDSMQIDAWATALNVLGAEAGYALAQKRRMAVMFIERRGDRLVHRMTPDFERYVDSSSL